MPIIDTPAGTLEVTNAILSASEFRATQKISVSNSAPTKNFSVGDKFHVSTTDADAVNITGNLVAQKLKIGNLLVSPTFDLAAVSNVGNTTSNTLQFANATTSFVASSNVEIGGNITLTSNAQVKVGSNVLAEYTGPHGRDPTTPLLKKYPEILFEEGKFDRNDTTNTYVQAGYTVTASSQYNASYAVHHTFNDVLQDIEAGAGGILWTSATSTYPAAGGDYIGTTHGIGTTYGEFIKLELPYKIKPKEVRIFPRTFQGGGAGNSQSPAQFKIFGSNDNFSSEIVELYHQNTDWVNNETWGVFDISHTTHFKHFGIVFTKTNGTNIVGVQEIEYYGYEEPAPPGDLSLDTTLKSTFNSVRSNNYVMYFDGEDPAVGNVPKYLPSGSAKSITPNNVVFDATNNCWSLDGSTESNVTTGSLGFEGDAPHTVSTWINASNLEANALTQQLFSIGSGYDKAFLKVDDTQIAANTWHNVTYAYQGEGGSKVTYVDGRKVEESQVEDTFGDYPPFAMTDYEVGGYRVSASNEGLSPDFLAWYAFDALGTNNNSWTPGSTYSSGTPATYPGSERLPGVDTSGATIPLGEWLKLQLPYKLVLSSLRFNSRSTTQSPKDFKIYGSNDDYNWDLLLTGVGTGANPNANLSDTVRGDEFAVNATKGYKYLAMSVQTVIGNAYMHIADLKYYGHKEGDLTRFPEPTRVLKYPHVTMTGPAQRGYVASASSVYSGGDASAREPYNAFGSQTIGSEGDIRWRSADNSGSLGSFTGSWLKLELPHKIVLSQIKYRAYHSSFSPESYVILASNNDSTWVKLHDATGQTNGTFTISSFSEGTPSTPYKYYAFLTRIITNSGTAVIINDLHFFGTQEDTGTPTIVGGPFAGKVANFRVYDQYLGDERIQEIYDAQKDAFGHKKSSMTFYKGRVGVGTTEPEGALTVLDEPHALAKFPARAISADDSYVEGDGQIKLSAADGTGYQAFDGLTSTSWDSTPTRNTRVSEEVDFGAWLKIQTPESMSLKKAEIESKPDWMRVGSEILGSAATTNFGKSVDCNHDGTRIISSAYQTASSPVGEVRVYDWNGSAWTQVGNTLAGPQSSPTQGYFGETSVSISGDGTIIAVGSRLEDPDGGTDKGTVRVFYLSGSTWTVLPDSGSETTNIGTGTSALRNDIFVGASNSDQLGYQTKLSYDGKTILMTAPNYDDLTNGVDSGQARIYTYSNGAWSRKGDFLVGSLDDHLGYSADMSEDGNCIVLGGFGGNNNNAWIYIWDGTSWVNRGASGTNPAFTRTDSDQFGKSCAISNDGTVIAFGVFNADIADGALSDNGGIVQVYHWSGTQWELKGTLHNKDATDDTFGSAVSLSGDGKRLIVGAQDDDTISANNGRLYTFEYNGSAWVRREPFASIGITSDVGDDTEIGRVRTAVISRDGSVIVSGERGFNSINGSDSGRVRVFSMPSNIKSIWGSNDDVNWTKIVSGPTREEATSNVAGLAFGYDDRLEFKNLDNPNYYKYHAIVADAFTRLKDIKLFGIRNQGSSTLHDGTLTLSKNLDVPRIGPPPDADDTPRRDRLVVEYNTSTNPVENGAVRDTSGRGLDGVFTTGAGYDATEKVLTFNGASTSGITVGGATGVGGDKPFSFGLWFNMTSYNNNGANSLVTFGNQTTNAQFLLTIDQSNGLIYGQFYGASVSIPISGGVQLGNWYHFVLSYPGGGHFNMSLYSNGVKGTNTEYGGNVTGLIPQNAAIEIGRYASSGNPGFNGKMSSFKFYDTALTAEEAKTLYDMGRCDEGGHVVNFSKTRVGIGLGDEEAPRGALDVRGESYFNNVGGVFNVTGRTTTRRLNEINFPIPPISSTRKQQFFWLAQFNELQWSYSEYLRFEYNLHYSRHLDQHNRGVTSGGYAIIATRSQGATGTGTQSDNESPVVRRVEYSSYRGFAEGPNFYYVRNRTRSKGYLVMGFRSTRGWTPAQGARVTGTIQYNGNLDNIDTFNGTVYKHGSEATTGSITDHATLFPSTTLPKNFVAQSGDTVTLHQASESTTYFTGQHTTYIEDLPDLTNHENNNGLIVSSNKNDYIHLTNHKIRGKEAITQDESLPITSLSTRQNDKTCFGVMSCKPFNEYSEKRFCVVNSLGEGAIWVLNTNGNLEAGDYITTSNVTGYGQKQDDDILRNYTVAKITMDCNFNPVSRPIKEILRSENGEYILDEDDQIQWTDTNETEMQYNIRYVDANCTIISQDEYTTKLSEGENVYIAAYVGCTYHCG